MLTVHLDRRPLSRFARLCGVGLMLLVTAPIAAIGRQSSATVSGTVADPSGRAVAGVAVSLANASGDLAVEIKTNQEGAFSVPVIAGTYQLQARYPASPCRANSSRLPRRACPALVVLRVGSIRERVTVAGGPAPIRRRRDGCALTRECTASHLP